MTTQPSESPAPLRTPTVAPGHWLWGHGVDIVRRPLDTLMELSRLGDVVQLRVGPTTAYLVNDPDLIKQVFLEVKVFAKQTTPYKRSRTVIGMGLGTSDGDFWRRQRRIAQPAFHRERISGFARTMLRAAESMADRWRPLAERGTPFDVAEEMAHVTLEIVCETLLGSDAGDAAKVVAPAFHELNRLISPYLYSFAPIPLWVPTPGNRAIRARIAELDGAVYGLIARRRREAVDSPDLLSMLLRARDAETGEGMSDLQLRDEVMTMLLAGHETSATTLAWTFYLLSRSPEAMQRLGDELDTVLAGRSPELADLERLPYSRNALDESLRLYPPLWATSRSVTADTTLGGYRIPRGSLVLTSSWTVHRSPSLWDEPNAFKPERFDAKAGVPRNAYFPFLGGPRMCIGVVFAQMQTQILLTTLAQRYRWSLVPGHIVEPEALVTLRPRHGVKVTIRAREGKKE